MASDVVAPETPSALPQAGAGVPAAVRSGSSAKISPTDIVCALARQHVIELEGFDTDVVVPAWLRRDVVFLHGPAAPEEVAVEMIEHQRASRRIWRVAVLLTLASAFACGIFFARLFHV